MYIHKEIVCIGTIPDSIIKVLKVKHDIKIISHIDTAKIDDERNFVLGLFGDDNNYYIVINIDEVSPLLVAYFAQFYGLNYANEDSYWRAFRVHLYGEDAGFVTLWE